MIYDTGMPVAGLQVSRTLNGHLARIFYFCTRHELHTHRYVFLRCMDSAFGVLVTFYSFSDRFRIALRRLRRSFVDCYASTSRKTLTMKIGYRLDPDDVWRTRYDTRP